MSRILPLFGAGTFGKSSNVTSQRRINLYAETFHDADKTARAYYSRPGLLSVEFALTGATAGAGGPFRGMIPAPVAVPVVAGATTGAVTYQSYLFYCQGDQMRAVLLSTGESYKVTFADTVSVDVPIGGIGSVSFAENGVQVLMVNGAEGYCVDFDSANTFTKSLLSLDVGAVGFPVGATSCCFIAGRFVVNDPFHPGRFHYSALLDGTSWDALDYFTAESLPDTLLAVTECRGELLCFGTESIEFWVPDPTDVFVRQGGAGIGWGLAAAKSVAKWNDGVVFLGRNGLGDRQVCLLRGYQVQVVSDPDVEFAISNDPAPDTATGMAFTSAGHSFYVLNLQNTTWVLDLTTQMWSEWETEGGRWAGHFGCAFRGKYLVSDYRDGRTYYLDDETYTDDGALMAREITSKHLFNNLDRVTVDQIVLDMETGVGLQGIDDPVDIDEADMSTESVQGSNPQVMMQYSKDGGHTFSNEMWQNMGRIGQYGARVVWNRLGRARDWVFRWRVTDPVKVVILQAAARVR